MRHWNISPMEEEEEVYQYRGSTGFCSSTPIHPSLMSCASSSAGRGGGGGGEGQNIIGSSLKEHLDFHPILRVRKENLDVSPLKEDSSEIVAMKTGGSSSYRISQGISLSTRLNFPDEKGNATDWSSPYKTPSRQSTAMLSHANDIKAGDFASVSCTEREQQELNTEATALPLASRKCASPSLSTPSKIRCSSQLRTESADERRQHSPCTPAAQNDPKEMELQTFSSVSLTPSHLSGRVESLPGASRSDFRTTAATTTTRSSTHPGIWPPPSSREMMPLSCEGKEKEATVMERAPWTTEVPKVAVNKRGEETSASSLLRSSRLGTPHWMGKARNDVGLEENMQHRRPPADRTMALGSDCSGEEQGNSMSSLFLPLHISHNSYFQSKEEEGEEEERGEGGLIRTMPDSTLSLSDPPPCPPSTSSQRYSRHLPLRDEEGMATASMMMMDMDGPSCSPSFSQTSSLFSFSSAAPPHSPSSPPYGSRHFSEDDMEDFHSSHSISGMSATWIADDGSYSASLYREKLAENLLFPSKHPSSQHTGIPTSNRMTPLPLRSLTEKYSHLNNGSGSAEGRSFHSIKERRLHEKGHRCWRSSSSSRRSSSSTRTSRSRSGGDGGHCSNHTCGGPAHGNGHKKREVKLLRKVSYSTPPAQGENQDHHHLLPSFPQYYDPQSYDEEKGVGVSPSLSHRHPPYPSASSISSNSVSHLMLSSPSLSSLAVPTLRRSPRVTDFSPVPTNISASTFIREDLWSRKQHSSHQEVLTPIMATSTTTRRRRRKGVLRAALPYRVLEAPSFPSNASQLLDWGSHNYLAIGLYHLLYLWHPTSGKSTKLVGLDPGEKIVRLTWVQHSSYIALASSTGLTRVYDGGNGKHLRMLRCGDASESTCQIGGNAERVFRMPRALSTLHARIQAPGVEGGSSTSMNIHPNRLAGDPLFTSPPPTCFGITGLAVRGPLLAVGTDAPEGLVRVFDLRMKEALVQTFQGFHHGAVTALSYSPMEPYYLATGSENGSVCVWDGRRSAAPRCISPNVHRGIVSVLQWNPRRSRRLISGGQDGVLCHLHTLYRNVGAEEEEEVPHTYCTSDAHTMSASAAPPFITRAHQTGYPITGAIWHPEKDEIVTSHSGERGELQLRHSKTFQLIGQFSSAVTSAGLSCLTLSPNKTDVCAAQGDETLKLWEVFNDRTDGTSPPSLIRTIPPGSSDHPPPSPISSGSQF